MADRGVIEAAVSEMVAVLPRRVEGKEFASAVSVYVRHFADVDNDALLSAIDGWHDTVERPYSLPAVRMLRALLPRGSRGDVEVEWLPVRFPPTPAQVKASRQFETAARRGMAGRPVPHTCNGSTFAGSCRECDRQLEARRLLAGLAAQLIGDGWEAVSPRPCRCDGSGLVDTAESRRAICSQDPDLIGNEYREVFPCPRCRPEQFERWSNPGVELAEAVA